MKSIKELKEEDKLERLAMNIVYQIGDELFERGVITVRQRQETNDLFIDFTKKCISEFISQSIKKRDDEITKFIKQFKTHDDLHVAKHYSDMDVQEMVNKFIDLILDTISNKENKPI